MTRTIPRLAAASDLLCNSGTILGFLAGVGQAPHVFEDNRAYTSQESLHFTVTATATNATLIAEGNVAQVWYSDTVYLEWDIANITKSRGKGAVYDVTCRPVSYRLTNCGFVKTDIVDPRGMPIFDDGVSQTSLTDLFTDKLVGNPNVSALLPWLAVGSIAPTAVIDLEWSNSTPQALIVAAVDAVQAVAGVPYDYRLVRNGTTSYDITVTAV